MLVLSKRSNAIFTIKKNEDMRTDPNKSSLPDPFSWEDPCVQKQISVRKQMFQFMTKKKDKENFEWIIGF